MDWRLIAAVALAVGSFCCVAIGARMVLTAGPQPATGAAPALVSAGPLLRAQPPILQPPALQPPSLQPPTLGREVSASPLAADTDSTAVTPVFAPAPTGAPPLVADQSLRRRPEPGAGYKTAALRPHDDVLPAERPARPLIETKRPSVVPELQTALPASHYRGVLTASEISRIRHNLRLTPEQEPAWSRVEAALAEMGRQQMALIRQGREPRISPDDWPTSRLYTVASPLLQTLRPDQKETVRKVCRSLGFESVASML
jgi:hypothetical protein